MDNNANILTLTNPLKRVRIENDDWIDKTPRSRLIERWKEQDFYIDYLELRLKQLQHSIESNEYLHEKEIECRKLKSMLNYRFLTKTTQQQFLKQMQVPSLSRLRQTYFDPSMNLIFDQMRHEIDRNRKVHDEIQNELQGLQFTTDSKIGKMLMIRCIKLLEENEQLGKMISSENLAKLECEIVLQNRLLSNMKGSQKDYEEIILDMDTNMDTMSNALFHIRNKLIDSHRQINILNEENIRLKTLYESNHSHRNQSTSNGTNHIDRSDISKKNKRLHSSNINVRNQLKPNNDLDDVDQIISSSSSLNEIMDISLNSTNNDNQQNFTSIENETIVTS